MKKRYETVLNSMKFITRCESNKIEDIIVAYYDWSREQIKLSYQRGYEYGYYKRKYSRGVRL